jgi:glycine cleavage system aminomethyltransferase T
MLLNSLTEFIQMPGQNLLVGRCRYGLMLNEDGMVYDDGVTTRLG